MIAACPKCAARYRVEREKLGSDGLRLRCTRCQAVFRVRAPAAPAAVPEAPPEAPPRAEADVPRAPSVSAPAPAPSPAPAAGPAPADRERSVLVAIPGEDLAKETAEALRARGLDPFVVHDGVEAMLEIQRRLPRAVVLSATLPKMYGFQVCEVVKRNDSLRDILVVLAGSIHHKERYRRPPGELYGADAYLEEPDLPDALFPILERGGMSVGPAPRAADPALEPPKPSVPSAPHVPAPPSVPPRPPATVAAPDSADGLGEERARAERLARIIVSDIVLYNEEKFARAVRDGNVAEVMAPDLQEGRGLFAERIDERVRSETDHLVDELLRVARSRGGA